MGFKNAPTWRPGLKRCMGAPIGDRIIVRPFPAQEVSEGGLHIPDSAKARPFAGRIVAAGDQAADKLWDVGIEIGDEIWWAKFGGVIEVWDHYVTDGDPTCEHDWTRGKTVKGCDHFVCSKCGADRIQENMLIMSVDDILCDVDLQERIEGGKLRRIRCETADGKTRYVTERTTDGRDTWEF